MLARDLELLVRFFDLLDQARDGDGDGRLIGEGFQELDLAIGESIRLEPAGDHADGGEDRAGEDERERRRVVNDRLGFVVGRVGRDDEPPHEAGAVGAGPAYR